MPDFAFFMIEFHTTSITLAFQATPVLPEWYPWYSFELSKTEIHRLFRKEEIFLSGTNIYPQSSTKDLERIFLWKDFQQYVFNSSRTDTHF